MKFTYVQTQFDYATGEVSVVNETAYSNGPRTRCMPMPMRPVKTSTAR